MKKLILVLGIIAAVVASAFVGLRIYTKQFSPLENAHYENGDVEIQVNYSAPYKNEREIFGNLVPYNEVWRTGANEATVFTTNSDLKINGETLSAGEYSLFTIPGEDSWQIIFNKQTDQWGLSIWTGEANRDASLDELVVTANAITTQDVFEQFTISIEQMGEELELILMWDQTLVVLPMEASKGN